MLTIVSCRPPAVEKFCFLLCPHCSAGLAPLIATLRACVCVCVCVCFRFVVLVINIGGLIGWSCTSVCVCVCVSVCVPPAS